MADFSFAVPTWTDGNPTFPNGTTVNATPLDGSPDDAVSAVASGGTVAFTGLVPFKQYVARATVNGVVREVRFTSPDSGGSSGASALTPTPVKTANYTAAASDLVPVDTTSGAVTITLPTAPADKAQVAVKLVVLGGSNAVTIARGGSDVFNKAGGSTSLTLSVVNQAAVLQYASGLGVWYVISTDVPLAGLDLRYPRLSASSGDTGKAIDAYTGSPISVGGAASPLQYTLGASVVAGDGTVTLDRAPLAGMASKRGWLVLDPFTTSCEVRRVSSVASAVVTLTDAYSTTYTRLHFDASRKVIELGVRISSISASGGTVTVVTARPHNFATSNTVIVSGTVGHDTFSGGTTAAKTITVTNSTTFTYTATTTGTEATGSVVLSSLYKKMAEIYDTSTLVVSGSASNNGVFTLVRDGSTDVNAIQVNETLVDEDANGVTVALKVRANRAHSSGATALWVTDNRISLLWYGYLPDGNTSSATINRTAIQRANDDSSYTGRWEVLFPPSSSAALIDGPVYQEELVPWIGVSPNQTSVKAHTTFPTGDTDKFMCHARLLGHACTPSGKNVELVRMLQRGIEWNGANLAHGGGICVGSEQPSELLDDVRVKNCNQTGSYGIYVAATQQIDMGRIMLIANWRNLGIFNAEHVFIASLDCETPGTAASGGCQVYCEDLATSTQANLNIRIDGYHFEDTGVVSNGFYLKNCYGLSGRGYASLAAGSTHLYVATGAGRQGTKATYDLDVTFGGSPTSAYMRTDVDRGITNEPAIISGNLRSRHVKAGPFSVGALGIPTKAGSFADADFDHVIDGLVGVNTTTKKLNYRAASTWYELDPAAGGGGGTTVVAGGGVLPSGAVAETFSRTVGTTAASVLLSQRVTLGAITLVAAQVISSITFITGSTALSGGNHQLFGLYDSALNLLATSADATSAAWAGSTAKTLALTAPFTIVTTGTYYLAVLVDATTVPNLQASPTAFPAVMQALTPKLTGSSSTTVTALPSSAAAITAGANHLYGYVS